MAKKKTEASAPVKALDLALASIEKQFGKGSIMKFGEEKLNEGIESIGTGILGIDLALGVPIPKGRIIEVFGPESCLSAESYLSYEVWSKDGKERRNHKGGSIRRLYERFHNTTCTKSIKQGLHLQNNNSKFYIKSVNHEDCIIKNEVLDVVKTGKKTCYRVETADGQVLYSTAEHKFRTPDGYFPLAELGIGTFLFVHNNTRTKGREKYLHRPDVIVKYHPGLPVKIVKDKNSKKEYLYHRGQVSRMIYEANLNGMSYDDYIFFLNNQSKYNINNLTFLPDNIHIHHEDENFNNNEIENLRLIDPKEHGALHARDRIKNLSFIAVTSPIVSIEEAGEMETYDLKCAYPYNNYIAEGIVVHNSGKTTLTLHIAAECQKAGGTVAFIDAEHALDPGYASDLGVDIPNTLISQPDCGEQALEITNTLVASGAVDLIIIDSVAALTPRAELEGEMGQSHMGLQARLMSQALRKLTGSIAKTNCTVIFINQLRMKIGVMFGNPETTTGGNALKFYASQRIDVRSSTMIKEGEDIVARVVKVKVVKNKVAPPFKVAELEIAFGEGFSREADLIKLAEEYGVINKAGAWYSYMDAKIGQGKQNVKSYLKENPEIYEEIREKVLTVVNTGELP